MALSQVTICSRNFIASPSLSEWRRQEPSRGIFSSVPVKTSAVHTAAVVSVVQGAGLRARDWEVSVAIVAPVVLCGLRLVSRGFAAISVCFVCLAAEMGAVGFLTVVDGFGGVRDLAAAVVAFAGVVPFATGVRARASYGRAVMPVGLAGCGVAVAAACAFGIVVFDEFFVGLGADGGVGRLSFVSFFGLPGWG